MKYSELFAAHRSKVSDKWQSYLDFYDRLTERIDPSLILEIGVQNGGSLELWAKKYPKAKLILGVDVDAKCGELSFEHESIKIVIGDAASDVLKNRVRELSPGFDLIVDDGSHKSSDIIRTLVSLLPLVRPGGTYVIEDLHASYWPSWEGGLVKQDSAMGFLKRLADILNAEHWDVPLRSADYLNGFTSITDEFTQALSMIKSLTFENSICLIELKSDGDSASLGERRVTGEASRVSGSPLLAQASISIPELSTPNLIDLHTLVSPHALAQKQQKIDALEGELNVIRNSRSWRWTAPFRRFGLSRKSNIQ